MPSWVGVLLLAAPPMVVEGELEPKERIVREATVAWAAVQSAYQKASGHSMAAVEAPIRITSSRQLRPHHAGLSTLGRVALRAPLGVVGTREWITLRHEIVHQFLLHACPAATKDRLFHEAVAIASSGELWSWLEDGYVSVPQALRILMKNPRLEHSTARRAIARLVAEGIRQNETWSAPLVRRIRHCTSGTRWPPMAPKELAEVLRFPTEDAFVVMERKTGQVLRSEGAVEVSMPFGSTLKPFVVAGAKAPPVLPTKPGWACGEVLPKRMDGSLALLRSCNPYFLTWAEQDPQAARFGQAGPFLETLGLLPAEGMAESIGLRPTLGLSPRQMAEAYRWLAKQHPVVLRDLHRNIEEGTLSGLGLKLKGATKTGTVRDAESVPRLGWIVFVDRRRVAVMTKRGRAPRRFAHELAQALRIQEK